MITAVAIFAIIAAIGLDLACDFKFKGIISNVCYSVIAAYIFYLIQICFPERKKKKLLATRIRGYILGKSSKFKSCVIQFMCPPFKGVVCKHILEKEEKKDNRGSDALLSYRKGKSPKAGP